MRLLSTFLVVVAATACATPPPLTGARPLVPVPSPLTSASPVPVISLRVAQPGPLTGYDRECGVGHKCVFGRPWVDTDRDGCDQRNQILAKSLTEITRSGCKVTAGTLIDPYTGITVAAPTGVHIDHIVPLAEMWRTGAATWPIEQRVAAANDLDNLMATSARANQTKGDDTPDRWMPLRQEVHCDYATRYVRIKTRYDLTVTIPERDRLAAALITCPR